MELQHRQILHSHDRSNFIPNGCQTLVKLYNVGITMVNHPPVIPSSIVGMSSIPRKMAGKHGIVLPVIPTGLVQKMATPASALNPVLEQAHRSRLFKKHSEMQATEA